MKMASEIGAVLNGYNPQLRLVVRLGRDYGQRPQGRYHQRLESPCGMELTKELQKCAMWSARDIGDFHLAYIAYILKSFKLENYFFDFSKIDYQILFQSIYV